MRSCPICGSNGFLFIAEMHFALFDDLDIPGDLQLVECQKCHFIYNNFEIGESDFARYYTANDHYLASKTGGSGGYSDKDAKRYARIFKQITPYINNARPAFLDFGCGKGGMLKWLKHNTDAKLIGVEANASCRSFVAGDLAVPVYSNITEVTEKVDVVILSHVLEHIFYPLVLIDELRLKNDNETIYYIEVPSAESYLQKEIKWQELYFEHINHFSAVALNNMVVTKGFKVLDKGKMPFYHCEESTPECLYLLAKTGGGEIDNNLFTCYGAEIEIKPAGKIISRVLENNDSVSIWGISQYTQLVLGSYPELAGKLKFLFDSSPAKIGRKINGVELIHPENLSLLDKGDILLIPDSLYAYEMKQYIKKKEYKFRQVIF